MGLLKMKKKETNVLTNKNDTAATTSKKSSRTSRSTTAKSAKTTEAAKTSKKEPIELGSEDSLKENKIKTEDVEMMSSSSDDDFEEVDSNKDTNSPIMVKSRKKTKIKQESKKTKSKPTTPKKEPVVLTKSDNILDNIDALLAMETKSKVLKSSNLNQTIEHENESDFEEVEMGKGEDYLAQILKQNKPTEINIQTKKTKKTVDYAAKVERMFKAAQKLLRIATIKSHIVCWLTHGLYLNKLCASQMISAQIVSLNLEPKKFQLVNFNKKILCDFLFKINKQFKLNEDDSFLKSILITEDNLSQAISEQKCANFLQYYLLVIVALRNLGVKVRLCVCFDVISMNQTEVKKIDPKKPTTSKKNNKILSSEEEMETDNSEESKPKKTKKRKSETEIKAKNTKKAKTSKTSERLSSKLSQLETSEDENEDDEIQPVSSPRSTNQSEDRFYWLEVYLEEEKTWTPVDPFDLKLKESSAEYFEKRFGKQVLYVCGFDNDQRVKDVTKRYASDWEVSTRLLRISHLEEKKLWYEKMLLRLQPYDFFLDIEEEQELKKKRLAKDLPNSLSEYKDHPYYLIKRHLLKFQSIYPENATPVGQFRNENVYSRDNMVTLHSRQTWLKYARVVKPYEKAYKIVKGRLKQSEYKQGIRDNPDLDLYGYWQTKRFEPPFAENGRIPRNEFGNVELFQPCMLPIGCVHIKGHPNLIKVCRKLKVDCVAAVVGFDAHGGFSHAVTDGWIVCTEHEEAVLAAYEQEEVEATKRLIEKNEERILNNWKKLVKGVLIREKLKLKYNNKITTKSSASLDKDDDDHHEIKANTSTKVEEKAALVKPKVVTKLEPKTETNSKKSQPKTSKPVVKNTQKSSKTRSKRKSNEDEDEEDIPYVEESESEYEEETNKKKRRVTTRKNATKKPSIRKVNKKTTANDERDEEEVNKVELNSNENVPLKTNNNDDDDLNLSDEE